ncbi:hypothetical protein NQ318_012864 [Aromia moschata]|uniref:PID domain-containing protein n=1 Tax=Aromia moschata TaxID=1265417 RepID=A0AAV8YFA8_9CUCU|nr:hypothetical protein NQ318_012864 [Aromia moschata]
MTKAFYDDKGWRKPKSRTIMPPISLSNPKQIVNTMDEGILPLVPPRHNYPNPPPRRLFPTKANRLKAKRDQYLRINPKKDKDNKKERQKQRRCYTTVSINRGCAISCTRYLGSTQLVCEGQPTKTTRMMQAEEAVSRIKCDKGKLVGGIQPDDSKLWATICIEQPESCSIEDESQAGTELESITENTVRPQSSGARVEGSPCFKENSHLGVGSAGTVFRLHFLGSVEVDEEGGRKRRKRLKKNMVEVAVTKIKLYDIR